MVEIIPAIIPRDIDDLQDKLIQIMPFAPIVQIDVTDGVFVKSQCWPYNIPGGDQAWHDIKEEKTGLPFWEKFDFEIDLMVANPEVAAVEWIRAGAKRLIIHIESTPDAVGLLRKLNKEYDAIKNSLMGLEIGIGVNVKTPNADIYKYFDELDQNGLPLADFVQFMGIRNVGFQGQEFDDTVILKIRDIREKYPHVIISVDGGVTEDNAPSLLAAGVNRLVSGSAIFNAPSTAQAMEYFQNLE